MPDVYVLFWFDVEDFITPESDDALKGIIEALDSHKVRGTFKLVGEKLRAMKRRGRWDIIDALRNHDIGYHTEMHSVHPTVAEYLEGLGWEKGIREFDRRERPGFEEIKLTFGVTPSCYGQPGSSWAPQVYPVLRSWGIPVYLDEASHVGLDDKPFWYCGVLNIFKLRKNATRFDPRQGERGLQDGIGAFDAIYRRLSESGGGLISIWYHPCEYATYEFWDAVNFSRGKNPDRADWILPRVKPREEMERGLSYFSRYVEYINSRPNVHCITASEACGFYPDEVKDRVFSAREIIGFARALGPRLTYQRVGSSAVSPAEIFYLVISLLKEVIQGYLTISNSHNAFEMVERFGARVPAGIYGPIRRTKSNPAPCDCVAFLNACGWAKDFIDANGRIPEAVPFGEGSLRPEDFLTTANSLVLKFFDSSLSGPATDGSLQGGNIEPVAGSLELEKQVTGEGVWGWVIFPEDFDAPEIIELARLQTWSLKPASNENRS